jgi:hypothetical protein
MTMNRAILDHPDFVIALNDLSFDFANLLIDQDADVLLATENGLARLNHTIGAERIGSARPAECRLALLP